MPREDGRSLTELRPFEIVLKTLKLADGSASFGFGDTNALAWMSDPIQTRLTSQTTFQDLP